MIKEKVIMTSILFIVIAGTIFRLLIIFSLIRGITTEQAEEKPPYEDKELKEFILKVMLPLDKYQKEPILNKINNEIKNESCYICKG